MKPETILFLCAHNDDHLIGGGGTIAKYLQQGKHVHTLIFAYGESSHPHFRRQVAVEMRVKESKNAQRILGANPTSYLGWKEGHFAEEAKRRKASLEKFVRDRNPSKIFTHSVDDPHPDHQAVYYIVTKLLDKMNCKADVYCFDVWNPINVATRSMPKLVVDVSETFGTKLRALSAHKSQRLARLSVSWNVYAKAFLNGLRYKVRYAEVFYKIR
ncbi:MAG: PIG-L deacetylase family protein [Candidatus Woesearchaeota archaeon]